MHETLGKPPPRAYVVLLYYNYNYIILTFFIIFLYFIYALYSRGKQMNVRKNIVGIKTKPKPIAR